MITGAAGYVGGRLVRTFLERGWDVHALLRERDPALPVEQSIGDLAAAGAPELIARALAGAETVVHLAGEDEVVCAREPMEALTATVRATHNVALACARTATRRLVYLSTMHVYGARIAPGVTLTEEMRPEPRSAYAISRLASEHLAAGILGEDCQLVVLRLTNSVGAPADARVDRWSLVANDLCRQGSVDGRLQLRSSGVQWRDFVALADVCSAIVIASRAHDPAVPTGIYNFGSGRPRTVRALAEMVQDAFGRETGTRPELRAPDPEREPPGAYYVSVERAQRHGLSAQAPLEDAVAESVRFCLHHKEELR